MELYVVSWIPHDSIPKNEGNIAKLLLDVTDNLPLSSGCEGVAPLCVDLHKVVCQVTASQVKTKDGVGESISLIDGDSVMPDLLHVIPVGDNAVLDGVLQGEDT